MAVGLCAIPAATSYAPATQGWLLAVLMGGSGLGQGLVVAPLVDTVLSRLHPDDAGAGSGVLNTVTQAGMALGVAAIGVLYRGFWAPTHRSRPFACRTPTLPTPST